MDPITLVSALVSLVPGVLHLFGHDTAAATTTKVIQIAQQVTGAPTGEEALSAMRLDPAKVLEFQKAILDQKVQLEQIAADREAANITADNDAARLATDRATALEGTASDLKAVPILGSVMLFARGAQRPLIGYGTMFLDYMEFSGAWKLPDGPMTNLFFFINALVLAFLFGERAVKNIAPLITDLLAAKAATIK